MPAIPTSTPTSRSRTRFRPSRAEWLSIYGTILHEHVVAASEAYNTALEAHLHRQLGVHFVDVPRPRGKRPVREISGVDPQLMKRWSSRRADIEDRVAVLTREFTEDHGRPPTDKESIALAQRANLETREAKHDPRSESEQRRGWHNQAADLLGERGIRIMLDSALTPDQRSRPEFTSVWLAQAADQVIGQLESHRATRQSWHMYAEAQRQCATSTSLPSRSLRRWSISSTPPLPGSST
ncbi:relaxase domain-containing protein [Nocardioides sp. B-3]|uniref:relaxase domain-containing protein n=1 Tax=Nocardioides sp. B-3 TaxID=2895565 RepID=UPI0021538E78|nr:relaxase domain-containing protein [Nocardioides sp. B-3]UUZ58575.1 relaxase domain-containing protein [Nocardioides sp. B-3]